MVKGETKTRSVNELSGSFGKKGGEGAEKWKWSEILEDTQLESFPYSHTLLGTLLWHVDFAVRIHTKLKHQHQPSKILVQSSFFPAPQQILDC